MCSVKIVQFGLCHSPNLGDGVIAECLAHGLRARAPGAEVVHVDISGRQARGATTIRNRRLVLAVLEALPRPLRHALARRRLNAMIDGVEGRWRAAARADLAVIGGGQLFSDANLNFPVKIGRAAGMIAEAGTPLAVHAVGVSRNWSAEGTALFAKVLGCDLRMVGCRDAASAEAWRAQMPGGPAPRLTADPGLLAADCYGAPGDAPRGIGLCITDFALLAHHADQDIAGGAAGPAFYASLAAALAGAGHEVTLFTNGAAEDEAELARLARSAALAPLLSAGQVRIAPAAASPAALARRIAGFEAVIAHRLHACILAYSYGRPIVGLGWDRKLQAFFGSVGLEDSFSADAAIDGAGVVRMVDAALAAGIAPEAHAKAIAAAWDGIDALLACVSPPGAG